MWCVRLFGTLELVNPSGAVTTFKGTKVGGVLAYLALNLGKSVTREELADVLWGDTDVANQRTRARQEIMALRKLFGEGEASPLMISPTSVCLSAEFVSTDVSEFLKLLEGAKREGDSAEKECTLFGVTALYRGDLLSDYLDIAQSERALFAQYFETALHDLATLRQARNDFSGAEESLKKLLAYNPLLEEVHIDLMRLYSVWGKPAPLRRQYAILQETLQKSVQSTPTSTTHQLVEDLLHRATLKASAFTASEQDALEEDFQEPHDTELKSLFQREGELLEPKPPLASLQKRPKSQWAVGLLCLLLALCVLPFVSHNRQASAPSQTSPLPPLEYNKEMWKYVYEPQAGEKGDAEPTAVVTNRSYGFSYVTGLVQTDKEDVDILTLQISKEGKLMKHARYSSPEHDMDRAFSIAQEIKQGNTVAVYVAGETFVPASPGVKEGFRLVLIKYDDSLKALWVRRSPTIVHNEQHNIRVISNDDGGITVGGTAFENGVHRMLLLRYNREGNLLWQKQFEPRDALSSVFSDMVQDEHGNIYVCGTALREKNEHGSHTEWATLCYDPSGNLLWSHYNSGSGHGADTARRIALSQREGFVYVFGEFYNGNPAEGGSGTNLALAQYGLDGTIRWTRSDPRSGPEVSASSMALNSSPKLVTLGGTKPTAERCSAVYLTQYDKEGNLRWRWQATPPAGFKGTTTPYLASTDREEISAVASLSPMPTSHQHEHSQYLLMALSPEGVLKTQRTFKMSGEMHKPNLCVKDPHDDSLLVLGQAQQSDNRMALVVLKY